MNSEETVLRTRQLAILGAPSALGLSPYPDDGPRAVDQAPAVLRSVGFADRIGADDLGDVVPGVPYRDLERPARGARNAADVAEYNRRVGGRVAEVVALGYFPLLLGGDCSILLGALEGLGGRARDLAVAYLDAHADFGSLEESPSGSACSMNLALAVGRDTQAAEELRPVVEATRVVHIGRRDDTDDAYGGAALRASPILDLPMDELRALGLDAALDRALERLTLASAGYWVHFDVDVLDPSVMPAVDSPLAGGFSTAEATVVLQRLLTRPQALGLQVTIYDPKQDPDRTAAQRLVDLLTAVLGGGGP